MAIHFQTQYRTKDLDIDEFFGKLSAFLGLQKRKEQPDFEKKKSPALKVEKVMKQMNNPSAEESDDEDMDDKELTLITRTRKKF